MQFEFTKIADGSVTGAKIGTGAVGSGNIAIGAVSTDKIADGAVTDVKIMGPISGDKLGIHTHSGSDIVDGTIPTSKIADGAITDAKITGPISASKLPDGVFQKKYANVLVVAKSGGDYDSPIVAISSISNASSTNPYLIKIMPGVYDLNTMPLYMKEFVDIEGSGKNATILQGNVATFYGNFSDGPGLVNGANHSELRDLSISNSCGSLPGAYLCTGIYNSMQDNSITKELSSFVAKNINVYTEGGSHSIGMNLWYASPSIMESSIEARNTEYGQSYGIVCNYNFIRLTDSTVTVKGDYRNYGILSQGLGNTEVDNAPATFVERAKFYLIGGAASNNYGIFMGDYTTTQGLAVIKDSMLALKGGNNTPIRIDMVQPETKCIDLYDGLYNPVYCQ